MPPTRPFDVIPSASSGGAGSPALLLVNSSVLEVGRVIGKTYATRIEVKTKRPRLRNLK
jgi:hypothetical protein